MKDESIFTGRWINDRLNEGRVDHPDDSYYEGLFESNF